MLRKIVAALLILPSVLLADYTVEELPFDAKATILGVSPNGHIVYRPFDQFWEEKLYILTPERENIQIHMYERSKLLSLESTAVNDEGVAAFTFHMGVQGWRKGVMVFDSKRNLYKEVPFPCNFSTYTSPKIHYILNNGDILITDTVDINRCWKDTNRIAFIYNIYTEQTTLFLGHTDFSHEDGYHGDGYIEEVKFTTDGTFLYDAKGPRKTVDGELADFFLNYLSSIRANETGQRFGRLRSLGVYVLWNPDDSYRLIADKRRQPLVMNEKGSVLFDWNDEGTAGGGGSTWYYDSKNRMIKIDNVFLEQINDSDQAVGSVTVKGAVIWDTENGVSYLNGLLSPQSPDVFLYRAIHIDNEGNILAKGVNNATNCQKFYVLTPNASTQTNSEP